MASTDITRGELEIEVPWEEVRKESDRVVEAFQRQVRIPGFRPGKAPASVVRARFKDDIRAEVLEKIVGRFFWKEAEEQDYQVIGTPSVSEVEFEDERPLKFTAKFEMLPDFELKDYKRVQAPFAEPEVSDDEVAAEIERLREQHASFKNLDPRPLADGDVAVVSLESGEVEDAPKISQSETTIVIGGENTLEGFTTALRGKSPDESVDFELTYPDDFANEKLAGKTIPFHAEVKGIRVKELPEADDDFAADVGDFRTLDELRSRIREEIADFKRRRATEAAKEKIVDILVERHPFPVPDLLVNRQIRSRLERTLSSLARQGVDVKNLNLDWAKIGEEQRPGALRDVRAGLLLERIGEVEAIEASPEEIEAEVERYARAERMTLAAARKKLSEEGALDRIESHIANEKVLNFLFDEAEKVEPPPAQAAEETAAEQGDAAPPASPEDPAASAAE